MKIGRTGHLVSRRSHFLHCLQAERVPKYANEPTRNSDSLAPIENQIDAMFVGEIYIWRQLLLEPAIVVATFQFKFFPT